MKNPVKKPSWWDEFAAFAIKGNAMALAVGTIIGAAFSTITKSLTDKLTELGKKKEEAAPAEPPKPSNEELLLTEIRDLLKEQK